MRFVNGFGIAETDMLDQRVINLMSCPRSGQPLVLSQNKLVTQDGKHEYSITVSGIPQLFINDANDDAGGRVVTQRVKEFYEDTPFPNYDDVDNIPSLIRKASAGIYARLLDEQLPFNIKVLDVGCGTGQFSNLLSVPNRLVVGADICLNSLELGRRFSLENGLRNITFVQMNLFYPPFKPESFDFVMCQGVLHHTADPLAGFRSILRLVKSGGYVLVGLYNRYGRLFHMLRRYIFNVSSNTRVKLLDPYLRSSRGSERQRTAWFHDQYKHPHESTHTYDEVLEQWFGRHYVQFVSAVPSSALDHRITPSTKLFDKQTVGSFIDRMLVQLRFVWAGSHEGGFFIMIGQKKAS